MIPYLIYNLSQFNSIQELGGERGSKRSITLFSPETSPNIEISPKKFWVLIWTLLHTAVKFQYHTSILVPVLNYWIWTNTKPRKNIFFRSNSCKIEVMITFLKEMAELPNFVHITISRSHMIKFCWWRHGYKHSYFKEAWNSQFCWHRHNYNQVD